jgi:hypothetical protein
MVPGTILNTRKIHVESYIPEICMACIYLVAMNEVHIPMYDNFLARIPSFVKKYRNNISATTPRCFLDTHSLILLLRRVFAEQQGGAAKKIVGSE